MPATAALQPATRRVSTVFVASGFAFASWASRIPQVRDRLHVDPGTLGLILLAIAVGSLVALPSSGAVIARIGAARTVAVMSVVLATGLAVIAVGFRWGVAPTMAGLFLLGFGNGAWDVAMNVEGATVEQQLGRALMPRLHAGFSIGTVAGAVVGAGVVAAGVPVTAHLLAVAVLVVLVVPLSTRGFLPWAPPEAQPHEPRRGALAAWTEPRTILIGVFVLCAAFTEGTGNDWLSIAVIDGYHARAVLGTIGFAVFLAAMTVGRWFGPGVIARFGRIATLRGSALLALVGLLLVVFGHTLALAYVGMAAWGAGAALGFPVGMSAAADDPRHAAARVSTVASIGYVAFLGGPPVIGLLGDHVGVLRSLLVAAALLALAALIVPALREPGTS